MLARLGLFALACLSLASCSSEGSQIRATGSSTIYPFTKLVADAFAKAGNKAPALTSTGTGAGIKAFCDTRGEQQYDLVDASRRMTRDEFNRCKTNRVGDIVEVPIGLDGIALAESNQGPKLALTRKDIYLALAANPMGKPNTAKTWRDVNPALPAVAIQVLGPPATSGTRASFVDLLLQPGCLEAYPDARQLQAAGDPARFESVCRQLRTDGPFVEEGEDDNAIVQALERTPTAVGLFGYSYLEGNASRLNGVPVDGVEPSYDAIANGKYPGMRTLYLYVKKDSIKRKPELQEFLNLYASMWEPKGPLTQHGLIALSDNVRRRAKEAITLGLPLDTSALL
jgi:phosphate transport system substrate-binding protein